MEGLIIEPIPKPKRRPKNKREPNPQKVKHSRIVDPDAIKAARRSYCLYCGISKSSVEKHVHHITPRSRGGDDTLDNLICLCVYCHERSHGKVVNDMPPIKANELKEFLAMDRGERD